MGRRPRAAARHRSARATGVRPRYGRIVSASGSVAVTVVSVLGAFGLLPTGGEDAFSQAPGSIAAAESGALARGSVVLGAVDAAALPERAEPPEPQRPVTAGGGPADPGGSEAVPAAVAGPGADSEELPARSGRGRRVVFDISAQRVWLVGPGGAVRRTYRVSGSLTDNLEPGSYEVYSTSRHAVGVDDSGTMQYMVRFAHGKHAAIGFHDIPVKHGRRLQTRAQLGTPQSHGCIRQARPDARALWYFATVGTPVVVTA